MCSLNTLPEELRLYVPLFCSVITKWVNVTRTRIICEMFIRVCVFTLCIFKDWVVCFCLCNQDGLWSSGLPAAVPADGAEDGGHVRLHPGHPGLHPAGRVRAGRRQLRDKSLKYLQCYEHSKWNGSCAVCFSGCPPELLVSGPEPPSHVSAVERHIQQVRLQISCLLKFTIFFCRHVVLKQVALLLLLSPHLDDEERLRVLVMMSAQELANGISYSGHMYAMTRSGRHLTPAGDLQETFSGMDQVTITTNSFFFFVSHPVVSLVCEQLFLCCLNIRWSSWRG